jgi:hypothetical protein
MSNIDDNFRALAAEVDSAGGLKAYSMEQLREAYEAGRLGTHVRTGISDKLAEHGLGHLPGELPSYQHEEVRLYSVGKSAGKIIEAVLRPSQQGDGLLREVASTDARETLQKVRELICD